MWRIVVVMRDKQSVKIVCDKCFGWQTRSRGPAEQHCENFHKCNTAPFVVLCNTYTSLEMAQVVLGFSHRIEGLLSEVVKQCICGKILSIQDMR